MIVLPPLDITDSVLTSSNVAAGANAEWLVGTSYSIANLVKVSFESDGVTPIPAKNFENLIAGLGKYPPDFSNLTSPAPATIDWLDLGATNRWAMFDQVNGTQTINADTIDVLLTPAQVINGVAILNVDALTIQVIVTDPIYGVVYDNTVNLQSAPVDDWYDWYFEPIIRDTDVVLLDLPAYPDATIQIIADNTGNNAAIGTLVIGAQKSLGTALHGTSTGIIDYSRKETDDYGNTSIQVRSFSKRADYVVRSATSSTGYVQNVLTDLRAAPAVWVGDDSLATTFVYGFIKDFEIVLSDAVWSDMALQIEGLA